MKIILLSFIAILFVSQLHAQKSTLAGTVLDEEKKPVMYATVSLLNCSDSTLLHYAISSEQGHFEMKNIPHGEYLFQAAAYGYTTMMKKINFQRDSLSLVMLSLAGKNLDEVTVEVAPVLIKADTIEYNSAAFKTRPDANTEDLLKKLPGVEVDRSGNIKAQGETVSKVLVDGKEFFGDDPKVATKNLPADAVKKVQVYDKKTEESELTGIDDGSNEKIINLVLKDGKKSATIGDVMAGGGTGEHYQSAAKVYRFRKKTQFAALGMLNNINQFGFTLTDYLSFSGGLRSLSDGDGMGQLLNNSSVPINFGQPVTGLITSGAGGLNYTYEKAKGKRFNISYLGNGSQKKLDETTYSRNFYNDFTYEKYDTSHSAARNQGHNLQLNWKNKIDTTQNISVRFNGSYAAGKTTSHSVNINEELNQIISRATYANTDNDDQFNAKLSASYLRRMYSKWRLFKLSGDGEFTNNNANTVLSNSVYYPLISFLQEQNLYQYNNSPVLRYNGTVSFTRKIQGKFYMEPNVRAGYETDKIKRTQGTYSENTIIDSLSPSFSTNYIYARPGINFKRNTDKKQFNVHLKAEFGQLNNTLNSTSIRQSRYFFPVPEINWENEYKSQRRINLSYYSTVRTASSYEALPVANTLNPLQVFTGNNFLRPEYAHNGNISWWIFDQFSMTSFFAGIQGTYTHDKISYARTVGSNLNQQLTMVNVPDDYRVNANADLTTPIRKLKLNMSLGLRETWSKSISPVNDVQNTTTNLVHGANLSFNNRKKEKWDVNTGFSVRYTQAQYSVGSMRSNNYFNYAYFAEISFTPNTSWSFFSSADVTSYTGTGFNSSITVPILKAEVKYYFLKDKRGILSLEAYDILNKNTGITRVSELNYLMEKKSSIIQQYVLLSFKFKLNKFDVNQGMDIQINKGNR